MVKLNYQMLKKKQKNKKKNYLLILVIYLAFLFYGIVHTFLFVWCFM